MKRENQIDDKSPFILEWMDDNLTTLRITHAGCEQLIKAGDTWEIDQSQETVLKRLCNRFSLRFGRYIDRNYILFNLFCLDPDAEISKEIIFSDFSYGAKARIADEISASSIGWSYSGANRNNAISEFVSYVIEFRRCVTFDKIDNSINIGLIYINKDKLEDEWYVFNGDKESLARKRNRSAKNCEIVDRVERTSRFVNEWRSKKKQKLELTWVGKDKRPRLEPRVLVEDSSKSHHANVRRGKGDVFDNLLIHGDNLLALKALEQEFSGKVKCVYIDPPYNTGNAFEHYDDGKEHSIWLGLMRERLELLSCLLAKEGSIWISLDDVEAHYCKVMCDEIFGRQNFIADVAWEKSDSPRMDARLFSTRYDHTLVFAKDVESLHINKISTGELPPHYSKTDEKGRRYYLQPMRKTGAGDGREDRPNLYFPIIAPDGSEVYPLRKDGSEGRWRWSKQKVESNLDIVEMSKTKNGWSVYYRIYAEENTGRPPETLWSFDFAGSNRNSKAEQTALFGKENAFSTPKPEKLLQRVLEIATNPGDLVLDSFLGSGTTAAVAHKMGRRWIGVELGDHCYTHCKVRLDKVIDGEDPGGITKAVGWKGGGGYRFYELAPTFITKDQWGQEVINRDYNSAMLAEAVCKLEGYVYSPSQDEYFIHGHATEKAFIYVTTNFMRKKNLAAISERLGEGRHLLICCKAFDKAVAGEFDNLTVRKIPDAVLNKCEWGHDDYSLNVANLPMAKEDVKIEQMELL